MFETGKLCMGLDERGRDWGSGPSQQSTLHAHMCSGVSMDTNAQPHGHRDLWKTRLGLLPPFSNPHVPEAHTGTRPG